MSLPNNRLTAELDGEFVIFMIGMRVNRPLQISAWLPVFLAMPRMVSELSRHPELGVLASQFHGLTLVQYWRSVEQLNAYAASREQTHLPAWRAFNRRARKAAGAVGIWHETYLVKPGHYENIYVDMPRSGLGKAGRLMPASGYRMGAKGRMMGQTPAD